MPILKLTNIYIGNDSGMLNLSAAIGTKSIGIFSATKSFNYSNNIIPVISQEGEISNTTDRLLDSKGKTIKDSKLATRVSVEDVYKKFNENFYSSIS